MSYPNRDTRHEPYRPTAEYRLSLEAALDTIFEDAQSEPAREDGFVRSRAWLAEGAFIVATDYCINIPRGIAVSLGVEPQTVVPGKRLHANIMTKRWAEEGLFAIREYAYYHRELQVINMLMTEDELASMTDKERLNESIDGRFEELDQRIHTPSDQEYMDLLAELASFSSADRIIE